MEYLRDEDVEKEKQTETSAGMIGTFVIEESSDKTETPTQDVDVSQPVESWPEQERKVSLVDRIKTIGKKCNIYILPTFNTN